MCEAAYRIALLGAKTPEVAAILGVSTRSVDQWIADIPEFSQALKRGRDDAVSHVAESLFKRACGYSHPEEQIFCFQGGIVRAKTVKHYPPDTAAAFIILKNKRPDLWRDKHEVEHSGPEGMPMDISDWTPEQCVEFLRARNAMPALVAESVKGESHVRSQLVERCDPKAGSPAPRAGNPTDSKNPARDVKGRGKASG